MSRQLGIATLATVTALVLAVGAVQDAAARGGGRLGGGGGMARGGGGGGGFAHGGGAGFSRAGPAAGGGFSARPSNSGRSHPGMVSRQPGAGSISGQHQRMQGGTQARNVGTSGQDDRADVRNTRQEERTERQGQRQEGMTDRTQSRQEGMSERSGNRTDAAQNIAGDWDDDYHHGDWDDNDNWGYAAAGAMVGAAVGYAAGAASAPTYVGSSPTIITTLPCAPQVTVVNGLSYYSCGATWYSQTMAAGSVTYTIVNPPPGY